MSDFVRLLLRLFAMYIVVLLVGTVCILVSHVMFFQAALPVLIRTELLHFVLSDLCIALLLLLLSWLRLKPVLLKAHVDKIHIYNRLLRFPYELFSGVIILAVIFIVLLHWFDIRGLLQRVSQPEILLNELFISVTTDLSISFVVAILILVFLKSTLRRYLIELSLTSLTKVKQHSLLREVYTIVIFGFVTLLIVHIRVTAYMQQVDGVSPLKYSGAIIFYLLFVLCMVLFSVKSWGKDLEFVLERLRLLSDKEVVMPMERIPVLSYKETASLALAFNKLQTQLTVIHRELAEQLELARQVQQRLLPDAMIDNERIQLAAYCEPCYEVGGDFYDVIALNERQLLIAIGDVAGKGMSAAMLMSALLAALRIEAAKGGSPGEILTRLNEQMYSITQGKSFVTIGLAIIDATEGELLVRYCSAGHMSPYLLTESGLLELEQASIPLGITDDHNYCKVEQSYKLAPKQILIMYTDGIIEESDSEQQMFGFDRWEQALHSLDRRRSPSQLLQPLIDQLPQASSTDDRTMLLVRCCM